MMVCLSVSQSDLCVYVCMYVRCEGEYVYDGQSVSQMHVCMYGVRESMCVMVCQSVSQMCVCVYVCMV
jgi:hypothetical protein